MDEDGYFYIDGRSDDVIISAGWTMSAVEIENALLAHPDVREAAVVAVADPLRGQIPKPSWWPRARATRFARELQDHVRGRLSQHEYPRRVEFVDELPKTPAGKINRKALRDHAAARPDGRDRVSFPTITDEALAPLRALMGKEIRRPEPYIEVGHPRRHPPLGPRHRRPQPLLGRGRRGAPDHLLRPGPHRVGLRGWPARHPRHVRAAPTSAGGAPSARESAWSARSVLLDLEEKPSSFARRAIKQTYRTTFVDDERRRRSARPTPGASAPSATPRASARSTRRSSPIATRRPRSRASAAATRRGDPRRRAPAWDDVAVGEALPEVVKGPLTVTSIIAFVQGWGSLYVRAHGLAFDLFDRHPALGIPNDFGVPEPPERVHWDPPSRGPSACPRPTTTGQSAWPGSATWSPTGWATRAPSPRLSVQVRRHNLIGDTTWCRGRVAAKALVGGQGEVTLDLQAVNQRDETIALGQAIVVLPRR